MDAVSPPDWPETVKTFSEQSCVAVSVPALDLLANRGGAREAGKAWLGGCSPVHGRNTVVLVFESLKYLVIQT